MTQRFKCIFQEQRLRVFRTDKTKIIGFLSDLERNPDSSFERNIVCEEEHSFMLTTENLSALRDLHDQVESGLYCIDLRPWVDLETG